MAAAVEPLIRQQLIDRREKLNDAAERLSQLLNDNHSLSPDSIISLCKHELHTFAEGKLPGDDLTLMAIRRTK